MPTLQIALYPGDGIGEEVMEQAVRVLRAVEALEGEGGYAFAFESFDWGVRHFERYGRVAPENFLDVLRPFDAILLGAVGWPAALPDHITLAPLKQIRQSFDQYACMRPAKLYPGVKSPLADKGPGDIDLVVIRENSEGEYVDNGGRFRKGAEVETAVQTAIHTRRGVDRVLRFGFEIARKRRRRLTMVTKSNALSYAYVMWDELLEEVQRDYPDVEANRLHCDAAAMDFVRRPEQFDVVVASNLFGDLLTDLGGVIAGGLGLAPSTNTNPEGVFPSMFEPVHGSAPDIAGSGVANPIAAILSAAMMLEHLGVAGGARRVERAVEETLAEGNRTPDLGGSLTTEQMGDEVLRRLRA